MPNITFIGQVQNAAGGALLLVIATATDIIVNETFSESYEITVPLPPGDYAVMIGAFTQGDFIFDVRGDYQSIAPEVPDDFGSKTREAYSLIV